MRVVRDGRAAVMLALGSWIRGSSEVGEIAATPPMRLHWWLSLASIQAVARSAAQFPAETQPW